MKKAIYPGSFDPITNGHLDILKRALEVFDEVVVLVADNQNKKQRFTVEERVLMIKDAVKEYKGVKVDSTHGLTVAYAKKVGATHLIRGLRAVTDFEYEFSLAEANRFIDSSIDMVFFMANPEHSYISSSAIDDMHKANVDISKLVPESVIKTYQKK
ncbi:MAG: pantetheine-phosphate adenylyltransferase [Bacilli bacterium]|nr:pantetheine-phosphate adenylyltransferase [Bacilli bacterium]